jgi:hypothetical protein
VLPWNFPSCRAMDDRLWRASGLGEAVRQHTPRRTGSYGKRCNTTTKAVSYIAVR